VAVASLRKSPKSGFDSNLNGAVSPRTFEANFRSITDRLHESLTRFVSRDHTVRPLRKQMLRKPLHRSGPRYRRLTLLILFIVFDSVKTSIASDRRSGRGSRPQFAGSSLAAVLSLDGARSPTSIRLSCAFLVTGIYPAASPRALCSFRPVTVGRIVRYTTRSSPSGACLLQIW